MSFYGNQAYLPCAQDEQVEWVNVLIPVPKIPAVSTYTLAEYAAAQSPYYDFTQMNPSDSATSPTSWDQLYAAASLPMVPLTDDEFLPTPFDPEFALALDECLNDPMALPPDMLPLTALTEQELLGISPEAHSPDFFPADSWSTNSPIGGSLGSPAATASPTTAADTPLCTPPTPNLEFCSEPSCSKVFEKVADRKKHERKHRQNFCCPICQKPHLDKRALDRHLWTNHEEHAKRTGAKSEKAKCRVCDYTSRADNVRRHERSQHPGLVPAKLR